MNSLACIYNGYNDESLDLLWKWALKQRFRSSFWPRDCVHMHALNDIIEILGLTIMWANLWLEILWFDNANEASYIYVLTG